MKGDHVVDARGLIREAYRIEGITAAQCRSIFFDWALALPEGMQSAEAIGIMLDLYAGGTGDHPMTQVLREGLEAGATEGRPRRRGGWRGRREG